MGLHDYGATPTVADVADGRLWQQRLAEGQWACLSWPKEYGGRGASALEQAVFAEEMAKARVPRQLNIVGPDLVGPMLIEYGSIDQQQRHLEAIRTGREMWCQLFSEPEAGSDLAHVQTVASPDDGGWTVSGQKVWTSGAKSADMGLLLARSGGDQAGLSMFLVPMHTDGIEVRPLLQIDRASKFNEVFLDGVRLPGEALLGGVGQGWRIAMGTLGCERLALGSQAVTLRSTLEEIVDAAELLGRKTPVFRDRAVGLWSRVWLLRTTWLRGVNAGTGLSDPALSVLKLSASELLRDITRLGADALGPHFVAGATGAPFAERFLAAPGQTIAGGTSEIQRNVLAERVLGLPRQ